MLQLGGIRYISCKMSSQIVLFESWAVWILHAVQRPLLNFSGERISFIIPEGSSFFLFRIVCDSHITVSKANVVLIMKHFHFLPNLLQILNMSKQIDRTGKLQQILDFCFVIVCIQASVADPGFPTGVPTSRGHQLPTRLHFKKFVCQNERIGDA